MELKYSYEGDGPIKRGWRSAKTYAKEKLFRRKPIDLILRENEDNELKRQLNVFDLTLLGIGGIIGSGIFVLTGVAAAKFAGPAVIISFVLGSIVAGLAALSYSEMASMVPIAGSAYTFTYTSIGELLAWIIGWDLILEYLVGAATVSVGWSGYAVSFLNDIFGSDFVSHKSKFVGSPLKWNMDIQAFETTGAYINLPAIIIVVIITIFLILGISESARINSIIVILKVLVVLMFIFGACAYVNPQNYQPFVPENEGRFEAYGVTGILHATTVVFFAYIGFDAITCAAQEAKNPKRDIPLGILISLGVSTVLYIAVCLVLVGVVPYFELDVPNPISIATRATGQRWLGIVVDLGALAGLTSVILVTLMGQTRILMSISRDGLLPPILGRIHPRFRTPYVTTIICGIVCAACGGLLPIDILGEMTSIGTLLAFFLVHVGVMILRFTAKDQRRRFRVPGGPFILPPLGAALSLLLMTSSSVQTIIRLVVWLVIGMVIYIFYGRRHSKIRSVAVNMAGSILSTPKRSIADEAKESKIFGDYEGDVRASDSGEGRHPPQV